MWRNKWGASGYQVQSCHFKIVLQNILPPAASNLSSEGDSEHMTKKYTYDSHEFLWHIFKEDLSINLSSIHLSTIHASLIALSYQRTISPNIHNLVGWSCGANLWGEKTTTWSKTDHKHCRSRIEWTKYWQLTRWIIRLDSCMQKRTWLD